MAPDKLKPDDTRVEHHTTTVNGKTYHYLLGRPAGKPVATILLVHGFPDISLGWRYQVPFLLSLGLRVIVPDMLGYGRTDSPVSLSAFSLKSMSADVAALARRVVGPTQQIILGGHDWGGALVWRVALWHPDLLAGVFSVCTPYNAPSPVYYPPERVVELVPNFAYQLQLAGPDVERAVRGREKIRQFLNGMYGGRGPAGEAAFDTSRGVALESLERLAPSPLLEAAELDFYAAEFAGNDGGSIRGPLNWYRTRKVNFDEELELVREGRTRVAVPAMMISARLDNALPPAMAAGMGKHFDRLVKTEVVEAHHWALWEAVEEVNRHIGEFVVGVLKGQGFKASICAGKGGQYCLPCVMFELVTYCTD